MMRALKGVRHLHTGTMKQAVSELSIPVPWGEIRGKVWGPDHGHPVLCLHGWADNCGTFNTFIPLLPKECRYVAMDLAGHGQSSHRRPGVFYSFPSYVMDVRRVIDGVWVHEVAGVNPLIQLKHQCLFMRQVRSLRVLAMQWNKFSIIGHSMGGNIAGLNEMPKVMRQGMDEMLQFEKKTEEKTRVYTYAKAVERLLAANPSLSVQSVRMLLERGLVQVEGGVVFSRDFRINLKNIVRISLEQSLEMQSRIQASVLVILAESGFEKIFAEPDQKKFTSALLQGYRDRNHTVVTVPGNHHVHLNNPEVVAPLVSDFLQTKVLSQLARLKNEQTSKL
ncbi:serine hydrolase-like protein isoform X2 [Micropterus salmoides]|uniref:serine hydrolase-like protein isoform X2 n=1 Tax=Micropterus salmoides TaxID=27706 RepID=UPI0018EA79BF|nr:serine hydrolase-like protein isoform X2 [Micropterus salmoides]